MSDYLKGKCIADLVLTSIARGYKNAVLIGERIPPVVLMDKEGARVPTFGKTAFVEYDTERAVETDGNVLVREKTGMLDLVLGEHDLATPVDYRKQAESVSNKESKAIRRVTNGMDLCREPIAARLAQDEKVYRTRHVKKLTASDRWVGGKKDPIEVIEAGMEAVRTATGLCPNPMAMGVGAMALLKFHPTIQAAIGANERKCITTEVLQDLFRAEEIVTGAPVPLLSMKAAMDRSSVPADIRGDNLTLHYVGRPQSGANSVDENESSFGRTPRREGTSVAGRYDGAGGKVEYCRYTDIYKVAVVGGNVEYLITGISK